MQTHGGSRIVYGLWKIDSRSGEQSWRINVNSHCQCRSLKVGVLCSEQLEACQLQHRVWYQSTQPCFCMKRKMRESLCFWPPVAEGYPVFCTGIACWREIFLVAVCKVCVYRDIWVHRSPLLRCVTALTKMRAPLMRMSNNSMDDVRKVGDKSAGVVSVIFMSSSFVKQLWVLQQNTELTNKTMLTNTLGQPSVAPSWLMID